MDKGRGRRTKPLGTFGLAPKNFPRGVRWRIDQDYTEQLTDAERQWLSDFNDAFYGSDYRDAPGHWTTAHKSAARAAKGAAQRDMYGWTDPVDWSDVVLEDAKSPDLVTDLTPVASHPDSRDMSPTPAYLNSREYKQAVNKLRKNIVKSRDRLDWHPRDTPELRESMLEVEEIVSRYVEREEE